jgi:hypothetical protein
MRVLGINGVRTDGGETTDVLLSELEKCGHQVVDANYRRTHLGTLKTYDRARQFADAQFIASAYWQPGCAAVCHSRGCLVAWRILELGYRFEALFLFRPAMTRDFILPLGQHNVVCIHRPDDRAIKWGARLPWNDFGDGGRFGLDDPRVENIEAPRYERTEFWRHSDDFLLPQVREWAHLVDDRLSGLDERG